MQTAGLIFGILGGICAVLGGLTAGGVMPLLGAELTWMFWLILAGVLLLVSIAFNTHRGGGGEY
jgi:hypothetical protein